MSMRILFADDSMTAQNMGKRILTDAGYEVIAVSNGAAAVKKIAEHKPDIIILDVYMPGYTGLEVCEKVRASSETVKTPVLLTVGKMEPYRAEDANRVKADGVIIKPFEASDLVAIVKKLEERVSPKVAAAAADQTILLDRPPDFSQFAAQNNNDSPAAATAPAPVAAEEPARAIHGMVEVPDHMATASAFSDLLGTEPAAMMEFSVPVAAPAPMAAPAPVAEPAAPEPVEFHVASEVPDFSVANEVTPALVAEPEPAAVAEAEVAPPSVPAPAPAGSALQISVVQSSGSVQVEAADETQALPVYREPELPPVEHHAAPVNFEAFPPEVSGFDHHAEAMHPENEWKPGEPPSLEVAVKAAEESAKSADGDDFDARVAAAMAAFDHAAEDEAVIGEVTPRTSKVPAFHASSVEAVPEFHTQERSAGETVANASEPEAPAVMETEAPVSFEYIPPVNTEREKIEAAAPESAVEPVSHESELPTAVVTAETLARATETQSRVEEQIVAGIESELPIAAAAAAGTSSGSDSHQVIAQIVHRVMERFKPELIAEIVRELGSTK